jgi:hypothetical protein
LEYPVTWQPTWNDCEQDLGYPVASSGAGWMRAETDAGHALLMQALKRLSKAVAKKHPLTARTLRGIFSLLHMSQSGHQLVWGLLLIGYFFLLRRGEFLKVGRRTCFCSAMRSSTTGTRDLAKHGMQQWWELFCAEGRIISLDGTR